MRYSQSALLALHNRLGRDFAFATFSNERRRGRRYNYACTGQSLAGTPGQSWRGWNKYPTLLSSPAPTALSSHLPIFLLFIKLEINFCQSACAFSYAPTTYIRLIFAFPSCGCSLARLVRRPVPIAVALVAEQRALQPYPYRCTSPDSPHHAWTHLLF